MNTNLDQLISHATDYTTVAIISRQSVNKVLEPGSWWTKARSSIEVLFVLQLCKTALKLNTVYTVSEYYANIIK